MESVSHSSRLLRDGNPADAEKAIFDEIASIRDNGVSKAYFWRELEKSRQERLSPHCPEVQGCIRCGVCRDLCRFDAIVVQ